MPVRFQQKIEGMVVAFRKGTSLTFDRMDLGTARFISEQIHLSFENSIKYQDAQRLVFIDDLSGLFNTRYLDLTLQTELKRAKRFKKHLSLLFMDIDHFKDINDQHGHLVGSKVLIESAKVLKQCVRDIDIVVRYGGDEFIMILIETDRDGAVKAAERVRSSIENHSFKAKDDLVIGLTCCVGIATFPDDADNKTDLIHLADQAMYRGKQTTRNVVYAATALK
jgi:diguanylate cyclase (GGDEF)-like protein